jgi:hypothetical protein
VAVRRWLLRVAEARLAALPAAQRAAQRWLPLSTALLRAAAGSTAEAEGLWREVVRDRRASGAPTEETLRCVLALGVHCRESNLRAHWVAVPETWRARRVNR